MVTDSAILLWAVPFAIWELVWKGIGLWKSARNGRKAWFVAILVFNTVGILPIIYVFFFHREAMQQPRRAKKKA